MDVVVKERNIHDRALANEITIYISSLADLFLDYRTNIDTCVLLLELMLDEEKPIRKLEQINVMFDKRNNKTSDMENGKFIIDIYFKHKNCFNTTHINYIIRK